MVMVETSKFRSRKMVVVKRLNLGLDKWLWVKRPNLGQKNGYG